MKCKTIATKIGAVSKDCDKVAQDIAACLQAINASHIISITQVSHEFSIVTTIIYE